MRLFFALVLGLSTFNAFAATWPLRLADLEPEQLAAVEPGQLAGFSAHDFTFISQEVTIGEHAIVVYGVENESVLCPDNASVYNHHYIWLYVKDQSIKQVTNHSQFGCNELNK